MRLRASLLALLPAVAFACDPETADVPPEDGTDAGAGVDAGGSRDASNPLSDAGDSPEDAGTSERDAAAEADTGTVEPTDMGSSGECVPLEPIACDASDECGPDQACLRGSCVDTCGVSLDGWSDAMPAGLVPIRNVCARTGIMAAGGDPSCEGGAHVWAITSRSAGANVVHEVRGGPLEEGPVGDVTTVELDPAGQVHFIGQNAAASPSGEAVVWGYTLGDVSGEVFMASLTGETGRWASAGNYDVDWWGDDRILVNGLSLEGAGSTGQGLYTLEPFAQQPKAARLTEGPGSASGAVSWAPARGEVLVGGSDGLDGSVYVIPESELSLDAPLDLAASSLTRFETASDFEWLAGRWLAGYDVTYTTYQYRELAGSTLGEAEPFVDTDVFVENVPLRGSERFLLVHTSGYLIVEAAP